MKSKAAGCGSISMVLSSIVLLCVSSIKIMIIIIIIINDLFASSIFIMALHVNRKKL